MKIHVLTALSFLSASAAAAAVPQTESNQEPKKLTAGVSMRIVASGEEGQEPSSYNQNLIVNLGRDGEWEMNEVAEWAPPHKKKGEIQAIQIKDVFFEEPGFAVCATGDPTKNPGAAIKYIWRNKKGDDKMALNLSSQKSEVAAVGSEPAKGEKDRLRSLYCTYYEKLPREVRGQKPKQVYALDD